jgi:hypothetical protein
MAEVEFGAGFRGYVDGSFYGFFFCFRLVSLQEGGDVVSSLFYEARLGPFDHQSVFCVHCDWCTGLA